MIHREIGLLDSNYSNSAEIFNKAIYIPFYPALTGHQISIISNTLIELFE